MRLLAFSAQGVFCATVLFDKMSKTLARAPKPGPSVDAQTYVRQVREIAKLISLGQWLPGITETTYAEKWGVSITAIRNRSAEARRLVQESFGDLSDLRADVMAQLIGIAQETRKKEPRTAVAALQTIGQITGLIVKHTVHHEAQSKARTPEEKRAEIARIRSQLDVAEQELNAIAPPSGEEVDEAWRYEAPKLEEPEH